MCVHHYIATPNAADVAKERQGRAAGEQGERWFKKIEFSFSTILNASIKVDTVTDLDFLKLADKYYDASIEPKKHLEECGVKDLKRGYAACSLPLILEHNTPNNSLALLWAESTGEKGHPMRPLFRRHQRHS